MGQLDIDVDGAQQAMEALYGATCQIDVGEDAGLPDMRHEVLGLREDRFDER